MGGPRNRPQGRESADLFLRKARIREESSDPKSSKTRTRWQVSDPPRKAYCQTIGLPGTLAQRADSEDGGPYAVLRILRGRTFPSHTLRSVSQNAQSTQSACDFTPVSRWKKSIVYLSPGRLWKCGKKTQVLTHFIIKPVRPALAYTRQC